ncbi:O-methyltransferase-domain-containing protein [Usnea florida]
MLIEMGILDALETKQDRRATATELAVSTGCSEMVVARLMRLACALCFCEEIDEQTYQANQITSCLIQPGWKGALRWMDLITPVVADMRRFLSSTNFVRSDEGQGLTPFEFVHGKSMWKVLEENPEQRRNFDLWMAERKRHEETLWHRRFPPSASLRPADLKIEPEAVLMVDVGGANGSQLINFKTQFPHLPGRFVLQDLPESIENCKPPEDVEAVAYNFFTPQPIKGARFYYFRSVFHNWPDEKCVEILRNVASAMDPEYSTLLIDDYVLPSKDAQLRSAIADVHMMIMFNSSERTSRQYECLLHDAGLQIVAIFPAGVNEESIIEAKVAKA